MLRAALPPAARISAGYSPISIGTEADGSICTTASRAALYGMKPTVGTTPKDGVFVISATFDTVGAMAKYVEDLAILVGYVQENGAESNGSFPNYQDLLQKDWSGLRLGFVDPDKWQLPPGLVTPIEEVSAQIKSSYMVAMENIRNSGCCEVIYVVELVQPKENGIAAAMDAAGPSQVARAAFWSVCHLAAEPR
ncbi:amidase signature domain-containing protein [Podospora fimiseda]|uniref:Amidase signature domain-containing protein n=1 Tax=Podospora fimiseda TaxID=252190 RepID=A0AAN6YMQ9_9PEZI|nr:amidase signature domain-containing protein [Podospora fimiseda]